MNRVKAAVGLSGGVDSAVATMLLKKRGYEVVGVHLYCYPAKSEVEKDGLTREEWIKKNGCRADEDRAAALKTALEIGIPFKVLDFSEEYNKRVVDYFYREYEAGRTPNPDVLCNSEIKFGLFLDWAIENGFDYVATGHYARRQLLQSDGQAELFIPEDKHKDQTYFLWKLTQKELKHILFPLAELTKTEVRRMATKEKLSVAKRPDSQGICFVGNVDARKFLARRLKEKSGEVKNTKGEIIGIHRGIWFYTIGQRGGWNIFPASQRKIAATQCHGDTPSLYVISRDAVKNELVVGLADEAMGERFRISETNWIAGKAPQCNSVMVRIRHGGKLIPASLSGNEAILSEPQRGIAPGQSAVFYAEDGSVSGGGVIE